MFAESKDSLFFFCMVSVISLKKRVPGISSDKE